LNFIVAETMKDAAEKVVAAASAAAYLIRIRAWLHRLRKKSPKPAALW